MLDNASRIPQELRYHNVLKPKYENMPDWESYSSDLLTEYQQSIEEGLDIESYEDVFKAVSRLPKNEVKKKLGDTLFEVVMHAKTVEGYPYLEPSTLEEIKNLRKQGDLRRFRMLPGCMRQSRMC